MGFWHAPCAEQTMPAPHSAFDVHPSGRHAWSMHTSVPSQSRSFVHAWRQRLLRHTFAPPHTMHTQLSRSLQTCGSELSQLGISLGLHACPRAATVSTASIAPIATAIALPRAVLIGRTAETSARGMSPRYGPSPRLTSARCICY
jgi:hypothetical protein